MSVKVKLLEGGFNCPQCGILLKPNNNLIAATRENDDSVAYRGGRWSLVFFCNEDCQEMAIKTEPWRGYG